MDVVVWLRSLGLGKYEAAFRENEVDETVLPSLTHETLKEIGVTPVGHRLKLLDAIAALSNDAGGKTVSVDATTASSAPSPHREVPTAAIGMCIQIRGLPGRRRWKLIHIFLGRTAEHPIDRPTAFQDIQCL
jgi:SAM domain (Sterile alpha motif)